jgi:HK97 family phage portal protein
MRIMGLEIRKAETRATPIPNEAGVPVSASNFLKLFGLDAMASASGIVVTEAEALKVPAIWAAVNFLAGTIAGLPMHVYKRGNSGHEQVKGGLATLLHDAVNPEMSSFEWRKYIFERAFTGGRAFTFIERNDTGKVVALWPLDPSAVTVHRKGWAREYHYSASGRKSVYAANEIIDLPFMLKADGINHRGPIATGRDVIALAIAATRFGSKFFENGGVPPFAITGPFQSGAAMGRAGDDLAAAVRKTSKEQRMALVLPNGMEIKPLGADAEKSQLVQLKRFCIEEIARIYQMPPVFLQDLTHGTYSNTEQQDLHLVKHTLKRWVEQFEQEINLKLFGPMNNRQFVELNMDGMLRGDFPSRMQGYAMAIQNGLNTPNELRRKENYPDDPNGNSLLIQGATVPLGSQPMAAPAPAPNDEENTDAA